MPSFDITTTQSFGVTADDRAAAIRRVLDILGESEATNGPTTIDGVRYIYNLREQGWIEDQGEQIPA